MPISLDMRSILPILRCCSYGLDSWGLVLHERMADSALLEIDTLGELL